MPLWERLVAEPEERVLPWLGVPRVHWKERTWQVGDPLPGEHGWYRFRVTGRKATVVSEDVAPLGFEEGQKTRTGYLVGDRLVDDRSQVRDQIDYLDALVRVTRPVFLLERGIGRFARVLVVEDKDRALIFVREELSLGPELEVERAWQDGLVSIDHVRDVAPALDLAFRWMVRQRERVAEARARAEAERARAAAQAEAERVAAEHRARVQAMIGTGAGRRELAEIDAHAAARAALAISGATLLDVRAGRGRRELVVAYRFRGRRLECVVDARTLRVIDAGICLRDYAADIRGDDFFTLESLPAVVGQAIDEDVLVVFRHHDD